MDNKCDWCRAAVPAQRAQRHGGQVYHPGCLRMKLRARVNPRFAVIDLETTGFFEEDRIVEVGIVQLDRWKVVDEYSRLVNPGRRIHPRAQAVNRIYARDYRKAPAFKEIAGEVWERLEGSICVAHNVSFDLRFLSRELGDCGYPVETLDWIDTRLLAGIVFPNERTALEAVAERLGIEQPANAHRALPDAQTTAAVLEGLSRQLMALPASRWPPGITVRHPSN